MEAAAGALASLLVNSLLRRFVRADESDVDAARLSASVRGGTLALHNAEINLEEPRLAEGTCARTASRDALWRDLVSSYWQPTTYFRVLSWDNSGNSRRKPNLADNLVKTLFLYQALPTRREMSNGAFCTQHWR